MAQFIAFEKGVEVNGQTILSVVNALQIGQETRRNILAVHGINPEPNKWYSQQAWLNAFKDIYEKIGDNTLFSIGKAIPENASFPSGIDTLEIALNSINVAYHMNHRGGDIGYYKLTAYNEKDKKAVMVCKNPYPSEFDRGIITTMLRKFKPESSLTYGVELDTSKESRIKGADNCTYMIFW